MGFLSTLRLARAAGRASARVGDGPAVLGQRAPRRLREPDAAWIAALVSPPPPSTADASDAVTRSQVHPLDANCLSCEQHARHGSDFCSSALAASIVAQSALAYLAA